MTSKNLCLLHVHVTRAYAYHSVFNYCYKSFAATTISIFESQLKGNNDDAQNKTVRGKNMNRHKD